MSKKLWNFDNSSLTYSIYKIIIIIILVGQTNVVFK